MMVTSISNILMILELGVACGVKLESFLQRYDFASPPVSLGENFTDYNGDEQCLFHCVITQCESFSVSGPDDVCFAIEGVQDDPVRAKMGHGIEAFSVAQVEFAPHIALFGRGPASGVTDFTLTTNSSLGANWIPDYSNDAANIIRPFGLVHNDGFFVCDNSCKYLPFGGDTWETNPSEQMGTPRRGAASVMLSSGVLWALGGHIGTSTTKTQSTEIFQGGVWSASKDLPDVRFALGAVKFPGNMVLAFGGTKGTSYMAEAWTYTYPSLQAFDQGVWKQVDSISPNKAFTADGLVYNAAGNPIAVIAGGITTGGVYLNKVESFDPTTELWTTLTSYDFSMRAGAAIMLDGKLMSFGGQNTAGVLENVMAYDPIADTWEHVMDVQGGISLALALRYNG